MKEAIGTLRTKRIVPWLVDVIIRLFEIELKKDADAMSAPSMRADGIYSIAIAKNDVGSASRRAKPDSGSNAGVPMTGLLQAGRVIDTGGGGLNKP